MVPQRTPERPTDASIPSVDRRRFLAGVAGATVAGTAGCLERSGGSDDPTSDDGTSGAAPGWKTYRGDRQCTGKAPADAGPGESLSVAWETSVIDLLEHREDLTAHRPNEDLSRGDRQIAGLFGDVTLTDELALCTALYQWWRIGSDGRNRWGGVVALDADDGSIAWTISGIPARYQAPTVADGRLYQFVRYPFDADADGVHVLVADAASGAVEARHSVSGVQRGSPTITADGIYHLAPPDVDGTVVRIDPDTGERSWITDAPTPEARRQPFTVTDESIVYGATVEETTTLVALDADGGDEQWRQPLGPPRLPSSVVGASPGAPSIADGRAFVAGRWAAFERGDVGGNALHSVSLDDRSDRWQFRPEPAPFEELHTPAARRCRAVEGCSISEGISGLRGTPLVLDDLVVVPGVGQPAPTGEASEHFRHVYAVSAADGSLQWSVPGRATSLVAAGDVIYARLVGDRLLAISTDGTVLDAVQTDVGASRARAPSVGHGRVYTSWGFSGNNVPGPDTVAATE